MVEGSLRIYVKYGGLIAILALLCACQVPFVGDSPALTPSGGATMALQVTSSAFTPGGVIPKQYTCDGKNISPPLAWAGVPSNAKSLVLIADDPDAPVGTWVHWVVFNIPSAVRELPEAIAPIETLSTGGTQGKSSFGKIGYGGPCPPSGAHRYFFKIYALDTELNLRSASTKDDVVKAMDGHVIAEGQLMGKYQRS